MNDRSTFRPIEELYPTKIGDCINIRKPARYEANSITSAALASLTESSRQLWVFKNSDLMPPFFSKDSLVTLDNIMEESMQLQIRGCANGYIISVINWAKSGTVPEKEYVAGDEKELAKLVEKLAKDSKEPVKK